MKQITLPLWNILQCHYGTGIFSSASMINYFASTIWSSSDNCRKHFIVCDGHSIFYNRFILVFYGRWEPNYMILGLFFLVGSISFFLFFPLIMKKFLQFFSLRQCQPALLNLDNTPLQNIASVVYSHIFLRDYLSVAGNKGMWACYRKACRHLGHNHSGQEHSQYSNWTFQKCSSCRVM